jgi:hypothetical protein
MFTILPGTIMIFFGVARDILRDVGVRQRGLFDLLARCIDATSIVPRNLPLTCTASVTDAFCTPPDRPAAIPRPEYSAVTQFTPQRMRDMRRDRSQHAQQGRHYPRRTRTSRCGFRLRRAESSQFQLRNPSSPARALQAIQHLHRGGNDRVELLAR